ncbi:MAG: valine--tRNA ligase [Bacteroidia bacterium]|nr:valine--tRNA ligase [Bacteroidia bacterium]
MSDTSSPASPSSTAYDPAQVEDSWYAFWEEQRLFHAEPESTKNPFTVVIPPPNITGMLTMGHVLNNTLQDIFLRWRRLSGDHACWIPGTDHAGIATQTVVEKTLKRDEGKSRHDLGREEFLKRVWEWRGTYGDIIIRQLRKLGVSCDWERTVFTMDPGLSHAVREAFIRLYKKGLIYRGKRIINWDPAAHTALSDEEVVYKEQQGKLWHIRYPVVIDGAPSATDFIVVATTRPETMLGDTAVAVHPEDERYTHLIGKTVLLPLMQREIPVIADDYVETAFGTGVVKITPAHDPNDFEVGARHGLPQINVMNVDASINELGGAYAGLDRYEARKRIVADLEELGLMEKIEDYTHSVGYSDRTDVAIEPYLSDQWFLSMRSLAAPALQVVRDGTIRFHPERWVKTYEHWMTNIRDWTISRQLWWGHRIPVYYCDTCGWMDALHETPASCPSCSAAVRQDEDVLDTWFSSWLWPFSVHHWPTDSPDLRYFYPTSLLVTAPDIIFFWVARMIMAGLEFMPDIPLPDGSKRSEAKDLVPFHDVYFTSIIRDEKGRKMSKSLGNSPDPLDVIAEYGADALRFTVVYLAPLGQDVLFSTQKCELGRNFANKLWNAGRFLLLYKQRLQDAGSWTGFGDTVDTEAMGIEDRWIFSRYHATIRDLRDGMDRFRVNEMAKILYDFIWHDFCDWYIELIKDRLYSDDSSVQLRTLQRALHIYDGILRLLHPIMPFITEELWHRLDERRAGASIMTQQHPVLHERMIDAAADGEMNFLQALVEGVRTILGEMNVPAGKSCDVHIACSSDWQLAAVNENTHFLRRLARINEVRSGMEVKRPRLSASAVVAGAEVFVPLEGLIDIDVERKRLEKEIARVTGLVNGIDSKLGNAKFLSNAPEDVVARERDKQAAFRLNLEKLHANLHSLDLD